MVASPPDVPGFHSVAALEEGGFGSVFTGIRSSTGGAVALKLLHRAPNIDEELLERRLRREIDAMVKLKGHPHVVQVEELVRTGDGPVVVMEFMDAGSVGHLMAQSQVAPKAIAKIAAGAARGLEAAHEVGIVHRDVKPQNILLNGFGQVKLCDFGIAAVVKSSEIRTRTTSLSVRYASPEELDDAPDIGPPTDVYSLGASLHHMLHGAPPSFADRGASAGSVASVGTADGETIDRTFLLLSSVVTSCLQATPDQRPPASELVGILEELAPTGPMSFSTANAHATAGHLASPNQLIDEVPGAGSTSDDPDDDRTEARSNRPRSRTPSGAAMPAAPTPTSTPPQAPPRSPMPLPDRRMQENREWWES